MTRSFALRASAASLAAAGLLAIAGPAFANPSPPTNGGNDAGQSGQCMGPAAERPTSCQSPGGVSGK